MLLWVAVLSVAYALALILPEMLGALEQLPPDADPAQAGRAVARAVAGPRLTAAIALATLTVALGAYWKVLPGLRGSDRGARGRPR